MNMYLLFWSAKETMFKMLDSSGVDFLEHLQVRSIIIPELYTKSDGFSFPEAGVFYGELETVAFKDPENDVEMNIELYVSQDFVCTYSVSE